MTAVSCLGNGSKKVLVCDDERHIVRLIQVNLERSGHKVEVAFDGRECLRKADENEFDVLILDGGLTVPLTARHVVDELNGRIPIVFMETTYEARRRDDDDWPGPSAGATLFIRKPFNPLDIIVWLDHS